jgi:prevent-host-death family protein
MEFRMDGKKGKTVKPYGSGFIDTSVARDGLSDTLNRVSYGKERIVIRRHGKEIAALVPMEDLAFLEELEDRLDLEEARAALAEAGTDDTIPWEKVKKDLGL